MRELRYIYIYIYKSVKYVDKPETINIVEIADCVDEVLKIETHMNPIELSVVRSLAK